MKQIKIMFVLMIALKGMVHGYPELTEHALKWEGKNEPLSTHTTNVSSSGEIGTEVFDFPVNSKIYHVWLIAYSQWFADMYGYPNDYVVDMPKGLHVLQFEIGNLRVSPRMSFHMLIDNSLGLDLPTHNVTSQFNHPMRFPKEIKSRLWSTLSDKEQSARYKFYDIFEEKSAYLHYFSRNTRIATLDYDPINKKRGASTSTGLLMYRNDYFMDMDYVKLYVSHYDKNLLSRPNASIWLKKKGGRDYRKWLQVKPEDFIKFKIPDEMRQQIIQLMDGLPPNDDMDYDHLYRQVYTKQIKQIREGKK